MMKRTVHYVPHTHYDAEVFLTRDETFEIGYSILIGALSEMKENPDFKFAVDQTCYIAPFLHAYPEYRPLFQQFIDEKRLEITCGMHAMPDVNIPSGESFIRQIISGKSWCKRELGVDVKSGWLLDTFGQHPQIPQLMVKSGFDYNLFQRLGELNGPTEFWWQGIDGSRLFCHWMRASYAVLYGAPNSLLEFKTFAGKRLNDLIKHASSEHILAVSGADLTHIEPHVTALFKQYNSTFDDLQFIISTPAEYFALVKDLPGYPVCEGDKNPVFQGCFSARIAVKQWNRKLETLLANAELLDALSLTLGVKSSGDRLREIWEPVLFNQFHDIICGSHVDKVYANVIDRYKGSHATGQLLLTAALDTLIDAIDTSLEPDESSHNSPSRIPIIVFNPLAWDRDDVAECNVAFTDKEVHEIDVRDSVGSTVPFDILSAERYSTGGIKRARILFIAQNVPSIGYEVYSVGNKSEDINDTYHSSLWSNQPDFLMADNHRDVIENEFLSLEIDAWNGAIRSLYDKTTDWEFIPVEKPFGGTIVKELDNGNFWEYNGHCKGDALMPMNRTHPLPIEGDARAAFSYHYGGDGRVTNGSARTEYNVNFAFGSGFFATRIRIYSGLPRVDIHTTLINQDERVRYRMAVPTTLHGGKVTHEIPFGAIQRPDGEFAAQNWIDYSDNARGLAVFNRGLPGNCVHDNVVMLSLLKCTALKEGYGEVGGFNRGTKTTDGYEKDVQHEFDYALFPHIGTWKDARLVQRGLEFNRPLLALKTGVHRGYLPKRLSFVTVSAANVIVSNVKAAEPLPNNIGEEIVVRVYESSGWETTDVEIRTAFDIESVTEVNLIEEEAPGSGVSVGRDGRSIRLDMGPFEIKTFRINWKPLAH